MKTRSIRFSITPGHLVGLALVVCLLGQLAPVPVRAADSPAVAGTAQNPADRFWTFYETWPQMQDFFPFGVYGGFICDIPGKEKAVVQVRLDLMVRHGLNIAWGPEPWTTYVHKRWKEGFLVPEVTPYGEWLYGTVLPKYEMSVLPSLEEWLRYTESPFAKCQRNTPLASRAELAEIEASPFVVQSLAMAAKLAKAYPRVVKGFVTDDEPDRYAAVVAAIELTEKHTGLPATPCMNSITEVIAIAKHTRLICGDLYVNADTANANWDIAAHLRKLNRECPDHVFWFLPLATAYSAHEPTKIGLRDPRPFREELRLQCWEALALGCKGYFYYNFSGNWPGESNLVDMASRPVRTNDLLTELGELAREIAAIGPLLLSCRADTSFPVTVASGRVRFPEFEGPAIDYGLLKDVRHDRYFLIPWNNDIRKGQSGTLSLPAALLAGRTVYDLMSLEPAAVRDGQLAVSLPPGGGRIFLLGSPSEFTQCRETIDRHRAQPLRVLARIARDIARAHGAVLTAADQLLAQARDAEKPGQWPLAQRRYREAAVAATTAAAEVPGYVDAQRVLVRVGDGLSQTEAQFRTNNRLLKLRIAESERDKLYVNPYLGDAVKEWRAVLVPEYYTAEDKFRSGAHDVAFLAQLAALAQRTEANAQTVEKAITKRLAEVRRPIKVAFVTENREEKEQLTAYAWATENVDITWFAPDAQGQLADDRGRRLRPADFNVVWIHQLRYQTAPVAGQEMTPAQALIPALLRPELLQAMHAHLEGGGGLLLTGIAGLYALPLGLERQPPDRLRENSYFMSGRVGLGMVPLAGFAGHPLFAGLRAEGFLTNGNAYLGNLFAECAWQQRAPSGTVLANELDVDRGRQDRYAAIVEYAAGAGKVLVIGGREVDLSPDDLPGGMISWRPYVPNPERRKPAALARVRQLTRNALIYLADRARFKP